MGAAADGPVTLVVVNARVWTGAPRRPWADALVVRGDRLALVGGSAEARKLALAAPDARVVDARGRLLVAGVGAAGGGTAGGGTLEVGGPADFVLVDRDVVRVTPEALRDAPVLLAVAGGRVVNDGTGDRPAAPARDG